MFFDELINGLLLELKVNPPGTPKALLKMVDDFDWAKWEKKLEKTIGPHHKRVADEQARRVALEHGLNADYVFDDPWVEEMATKYVASRVVSVTGTTKADLKDKIRSYLAEQRGPSTPHDLAKGIGDMLRAQAAGYAQFRAERLARSETAIAYNHGSMFRYHRAGIKKVQVDDGDGDAACKAAHGQVWTIDQALANPIAHPNCTRSFSPVIEEPAQVADNPTPTPPPVKPAPKPDPDPAQPKPTAGDDEPRPLWADSVVRRMGSAYEQRLSEHSLEYFDKLPDYARTSIKAYTGSSYADMNDYLRNGDKADVSENIKSRARNVVEALKGAPQLPEPTVVWRGMRAHGVYGPERDAWAAETFTPGKVIRMDGIQSTSIDPTFSASWGTSGVTLEIHTKHGLYVEPVTASDGEHEMLMNHKQAYKVIGIKEVKIAASPTSPARMQKVIQLVHIGDAPDNMAPIKLPKRKAIGDAAFLDKFMQDPEFTYEAE